MAPRALQILPPAAGWALSVRRVGLCGWHRGSAALRRARSAGDCGGVAPRGGTWGSAVALAAVWAA
jgi:hypothetical protein